MTYAHGQGHADVQPGSDGGQLNLPRGGHAKLPGGGQRDYFA